MITTLTSHKFKSSSYKSGHLTLQVITCQLTCEHNLNNDCCRSVVQQIEEHDNLIGKNFKGGHLEEGQARVWMLAKEADFPRL